MVDQRRLFLFSSFACALGFAACGDGSGDTRDTDSLSTTLPTTQTSTATMTQGGSETGSDSESSGASEAGSETQGSTDATTVDPSEGSSGGSGCGDGVVDDGEVCDDGPQNGGYGFCLADCSGLGPHCGDGIIHPTEGETCDDGDTIDDNSCNNNCEPVPCDQQGGNDGGEVLSYIWIANDTQGTVSKINTVTAVEEGRYRVEGARPSRTSVNLQGDVAVSSREPGAVTKIAAQLDDCIDTNQNGMIETSQGPDDILPLGEDECVLWRRSIPSPNYDNGPRATAWVAEKQDPVTCDYPEARLWMAWRDNDKNAHFELIDGVTGDTIETIVHPYPDGDGSKNPYGGAVDRDGNFYVTGVRAQDVLKVDIETGVVTNLGEPPGSPRRYGMTLDAQGDLWAGGYDGAIHRWHHDSNTWTVYPDGTGADLRGIAVDSENQVWAARSSPCQLAHFDSETETFVNASIPLPGCDTPWGVAVDFEGNVWVVDRGDKAYKIDRNTYEVLAIVTGLVDPYSYSDMTGAALKLQEIG